MQAGLITSKQSSIESSSNEEARVKSDLIKTAFKNRVIVHEGSIGSHLSDIKDESNRKQSSEIQRIHPDHLGDVNISKVEIAETKEDIPKNNTNEISKNDETIMPGQVNIPEEVNDLNDDHIDHDDHDHKNENENLSIKTAKSISTNRIEDVAKAIAFHSKVKAIKNKEQNHSAQSPPSPPPLSSSSQPSAIANGSLKTAQSERSESLESAMSINPSKTASVVCSFNH